MTQSRCFDASLSSQTFSPYSLDDILSPAENDTSKYSCTEYAGSSQFTPPSPHSSSLFSTLHMLSLIVTVVYVIFNLPFILSIGYDMLLTITILAISPILYSHRYGLLLHITALWSLIYTLRSFVQHHLNPFYYVSLICILVDQMRTYMLDLNRYGRRAAASICLLLMTCLILLFGHRIDHSWRIFSDMIWLGVMLVTLWHSP